MGLIDGWRGSECHWVVINSCQCQPMHPSLVCEEQSCVYQSQCVLASSTNFMVLTCAAKCGHCASLYKGKFHRVYLGNAVWWECVKTVERKENGFVKD